MVRKERAQKRTYPESILIGLGAAGILTVILLLLVTLCIDNEYLKIMNSGYYSPVIQFISVFTGVWIATAIEKEKRILGAAGVAGVYYLVCIIVGMLFFEGNSAAALTGFVIVLIAAVAALFVQSVVVGRSKLGKKRRRAW